MQSHLGGAGLPIDTLKLLDRLDFERRTLARRAADKLSDFEAAGIC
jgi:hypothetical protein